MKYTLRKWIDWGADHYPDKYPSAWHYIKSVGKWDSAWNMKVSEAIMFDDWDSAAAFRVEYSGILGEKNSQYVEIVSFTDKELFELKLKGE